MNTLKRFLYNPVILVILGAVIAPILTDIYNRVPFATTFLLAYQWILTILNCDIKAWVYCVTLAIGVGIYRIQKNKQPQQTQIQNVNNDDFDQIAYNPLDEDDVPIQILDRMNEDIEKKHNDEADKLRRMLEYTADIFLDYTWEWRWIKNEKVGVYEVKYLQVCCPRPECNHFPMIQEGLGGITTNFFCTSCRNYYSVISFEFGNLDTTIADMIRLKVSEF